jgi:hypothetical protein
MENIDLDRIPTKKPGIVSRILESEIPQQTEGVLVLPNKGEVKIINEVGARIWSLIDGEKSIREIVAIICSEFEVSSVVAEIDALSFVTELVKREIISLE